jgi:hypothetical protein
MKTVIFPMMMFTFMFLKRVRTNMDKHDSTSKLMLIRCSMTFIWRVCDIAEDNPLSQLGFDKSTKAEFLNKYTGLMYHLKVKRSNLIILNELLTFVRKFVFAINSKDVKIKRIDNHAGGTDINSSWEELLRSLRLDNLMELYDYV